MIGAFLSNGSAVLEYVFVVSNYTVWLYSIKQ